MSAFDPKRTSSTCAVREGFKLLPETSFKCASDPEAVSILACFRSSEVPVGRSGKIRETLPASATKHSGTAVTGQRQRTAHFAIRTIAVLNPFPDISMHVMQPER